MVVKRIDKFTIILLGILIITIISMFLGISKKENLKEIKIVELTSGNKNYQEQEEGAWNLTKTAKWTGFHQAQINLEFDSVTKYTGKSQDVLFVIDISGSMSGDKINKVKNDVKELSESLLSGPNRVGIITFSNESGILLDLTDNLDEVITAVDHLSVYGMTNYYRAFVNVADILKNYKKESDREFAVLFLTDGYPNEETPNQIGEYNIIKNTYPFAEIAGIQYEMGDEILDPVVQVSDVQYIAYMKNLNNILFEAIDINVAETFENVEIIDYISDDFIVESEDDIHYNIGSISIEEENGKQKVVWSIPSDTLKTGVNVRLKIDVSLKEEAAEKEYVITNEKEEVKVKLFNEDEEDIISYIKPTLKNKYEVVYDGNQPNDCNATNIPSVKSYSPFELVTIEDSATCNQYNFNNWKIVTENVTKANSKTFVMPGNDVNLVATWSRPSISKSMEGTIQEAMTMYDIVENEALNGSEARLYSGESSDGGNKNIYYYTGNVTKNNVVFAGYCWQMVRTTDTGGVKLVYNGETDASGKCESNRSNTNAGYSSMVTNNLTSSYLYGTSYLYNKSTNEFILKDTEVFDKLTSDNQNDIVGKYTCKSNIGTCTTLYYVDSYVSDSTANVIPLNNNIPYYQIGTSSFNSNYTSISSLGYMNNGLYPVSSSKMTAEGPFITEISLVNPGNYYGTGYTKSGRNYSLKNATKLNSVSQNISGKYVLYPTTSSTGGIWVEYLLAIDSTYGDDCFYYSYSILNNDTVTTANKTFKFGTELLDNGNGTYTISGTIKSTKRSTWYKEYTNFVNLYTCGSDSLTCAKPQYTISTGDLRYDYVNVDNNYIYGNTFDYDEDTGMYTLNDTIQFWNYSNNYTEISNHHYTCLNKTGTCSTLYYIYYSNSSTPYYISLNNGENVSDALNKILDSNSTNSSDSNIKKIVDLWFKNNMIEYNDYLEDTIFCNDRSINSKGGFDENGSISSYLNFKNFNSSSDLKCDNILDKFTVSNELGNESLTYPVGLLTKAEVYLWGSTASKTGANWWLSSPYYFTTSANGSYVSSSGGISYAGVNSSMGIRPVISLKASTLYGGGDGSQENPYVILTD